MQRSCVKNAFVAEILASERLDVVVLDKRQVGEGSENRRAISEASRYSTSMPICWRAVPYLYLRTTDDNRVFVGGEDDRFGNPEKRDRQVKAKTDRLAKRFCEMFPAVELEVAYRWAGTFGETEDGLPFIGQIPQMPRCYFALGFGGNGIIHSMIAAEIIRDAVLNRRNTDARLFRFDR
jgi:glycine/D-amino acid oxidase-like deaminating enzyme